MKARHLTKAEIDGQALEIFRRLSGHKEAPAIWMLELPGETPLSTVDAVTGGEWQHAFLFVTIQALLVDGVHKELILRSIFSP